MFSTIKIFLFVSIFILLSNNVFAQKPELYVQTGHAGPIYSIAYSPDGRMLVSASEDKTVKLWDVETKREIRTLQGDGRIMSVVFSPNGKMVEVAKASPDLTHTNGSGVRDVRLFRNGSLIKAWRDDVVITVQGKTTLETDVSLIAGNNMLTAYAFNRDNVKSLDASAKIIGTDSLKRKGTAYILAIGVNAYSNPQFNLKYAVPDAQIFSKEVQQQQIKLDNFDRVETISLLDKQATKENILQALKYFAGETDNFSATLPELKKIKPVQPEDSLIIYFAGHGFASKNQFYLVPHNLGYTGSRPKLSTADLQTILANSVSDRELEAAFEKIDAGQMLLVIDACNSGQALEAQEKRRGPMNSKGLAQLAYEKGMYILTASQSYQAALEATQLGHGYLTYALVIEGLSEFRSDNFPKDGILMIREWFDYTIERVPQMQQTKFIANLPQTQTNQAATSKTTKNKSRKNRQLERENNGTTTVPLNAERDFQLPRLFYRRETETIPYIIARK